MTRTPQPMRRSVHTVGLIVFLIALAVLFGASMLAYVWIRVLGPQTVSNQSVHVHVPSLLWASTALVLAVSLTLHLAVSAIRIERHEPLRRWLLVSMALAIGFIAVQTPAMAMLLRQHAAAQSAGAPGMRLHVYGLIFFLVLLHALHVVGGVVALGWSIRQENRGRYDHENHLGVKHVAMYWHFLDVVWLVMFGTFLVVG